MSLKYFFSNSLSILWGILSFISLFLWPMGIYHAAKKHSKTAFYCSLFPLVGDYYGIESFWHKKNADTEVSEISDSIDWNRRIPTDINTACQLILISDDPSDIDNINMQIENFGKKMRSYPVVKKTQIANGVATFLRYNINATVDLDNWVTELIKDTSITFEYSNQSNAEYDSLIYYYKLPIAKQMKELNDSSFKVVDFKTFTAEQLNEVTSKTKQKLQIYTSTYHSVYKSIFNEDYN